MRRRGRRRGSSPPAATTTRSSSTTAGRTTATRQVFDDFRRRPASSVELRGGTGPELFERLEREGDDTPADVLVTTDLANLWRAEDAGPAQPASTTPTLEANVPEALRDPGGEWWPLTTRLRVPVVSTERVAAGEVTSYEDLGDPQFQGRTCLRTSNNEYNQSLVADMHRQARARATEALLRSWMDNDPKIINSDGELLAGDGRRRLRRRPDQPLLPGPRARRGPRLPGRARRGPTRTAPAPTPTCRAPASCAGPTSARRGDRSCSSTSRRRAAQEEIVERRRVRRSTRRCRPPTTSRDWADVKIDPIAVDEAGPLLDDAIALMLEVGWN